MPNTFLSDYKILGGIHPETACVKSVLTYHGTNAPHTGQPYTESMLLGLGGGLGAIYILWEFQGRSYPSMVLGFRNKLNYAVRYTENLCKQIGATTKVFETAGKKKAAVQLEEVLAGGDPAIAWVDLGGMPYYMHFALSGTKVIYGIKENDYWVDHLARKPYIIPSDLMIEARSRVPSYKNRLMTITPGSEVDLVAAIKTGIRDHISYMGSSSTSFALASIRKWARMMTDIKNKKGWPVAFKGGVGLYGTLRGMYEAIEIVGTEGGGMRGMYGEFLDQAAVLLNNGELRPVADMYRSIDKQWRALAQATLPDSYDSFRRTKELLAGRKKLRMAEATDGLDLIVPLSDELHEIKRVLNDDFPMEEVQMLEFFADIKSHLESIYESEIDTLAALRVASEPT